MWFLGKYFISEEMLWVGEMPGLHTVWGRRFCGAPSSAHTLLSFSNISNILRYFMRNHRKIIGNVVEISEEMLWVGEMPGLHTVINQIHRLNTN